MQFERKLEFETGAAFVARTRPQTRPGIDWSEVRRNLPASATRRPQLAKPVEKKTSTMPNQQRRYQQPAAASPAHTCKGQRLVRNKSFVVEPSQPRSKQQPASAAAAVTSGDGQPPLTTADKEKLRDFQNFFSFDQNTGAISTSKTLISSRGIAVNVRTQPSMQLLSLRAASLLPASERARLPRAIQAKLPRYSTLKAWCFSHDAYEDSCFLCQERRTICLAAKA